MVARQTFLTSTSIPSDLAVILVSELAAGYAQVTVAKRLQLPKQRVSYWAAKAVKRGVLKRISRSPAIYSAGPNFAESHVILHESERILAYSERESKKEARILTPHRLGFSFFLKRPISDWTPFGFEECGSPNNWRMYQKLEPDMKIVGYRNKVHFWIHLTAGKNPQKQVDNSVALVNARAAVLAKDTMNQLSYDSPVSSPEWEVCDVPLAEYLGRVLELKHAPVDLGDSQLIQDGSHEHPEIIGPGATEKAKVMHWLMNEAQDSVIKLAQGQLETNNGLLKTHDQLDLLTRLVGDIVEAMKR